MKAVSFGLAKVIASTLLTPSVFAPVSHAPWKTDGVKSVDAITFARPLSLVLVSLSFVMVFLLFSSRPSKLIVSRIQRILYNSFFVAASCSETIALKI